MQVRKGDFNSSNFILAHCHSSLLIYYIPAYLLLNFGIVRVMPASFEYVHTLDRQWKQWLWKIPPNCRHAHSFQTLSKAFLTTLLLVPLFFLNYLVNSCTTCSSTHFENSTIFLFQCIHCIALDPKKFWKRWIARAFCKLFSLVVPVY